MKTIPVFIAVIETGSRCERIAVSEVFTNEKQATNWLYCKYREEYPNADKSAFQQDLRECGNPDCNISIISTTLTQTEPDAPVITHTQELDAMREALAKQDAENWGNEYETMYIIALEGCPGYNNISDDEIRDQYERTINISFTEE